MVRKGLRAVGPVGGDEPDDPDAFEDSSHVYDAHDDDGPWDDDGTDEPDDEPDDAVRESDGDPGRLAPPWEAEAEAAARLAASEADLDAWLAAGEVDRAAGLAADEARAYAADVTVRLPGLRALAEWVCDRPHRRRLAALVVDGHDVVLWHEGRATPRLVRAAAPVGAAAARLAELPVATRVGSLDDLAAIPRGWQDPHGATVTMTCPGCRRDYTAAAWGGTAAQMTYLGLLDVKDLNRLPAVADFVLAPRRVPPRRGAALCFVAHRVTR